MSGLFLIQNSGIREFKRSQIYPYALRVYTKIKFFPTRVGNCKFKLSNTGTFKIEELQLKFCMLLKEGTLTCILI